MRWWLTEDWKYMKILTLRFQNSRSTSSLNCVSPLLCLVSRGQMESFETCPFARNQNQPDHVFWKSCLPSPGWLGRTPGLYCWWHSNPANPFVGNEMWIERDGIEDWLMFNLVEKIYRYLLVTKFWSGGWLDTSPLMIMIIIDHVWDHWCSIPIKRSCLVAKWFAPVNRALGYVANMTKYFEKDSERIKNVSRYLSVGRSFMEEEVFRVVVKW